MYYYIKIYRQPFMTFENLLIIVPFMCIKRSFQKNDKQINNPKRNKYYNSHINKRIIPN